MHHHTFRHHLAFIASFMIIFLLPLPSLAQSGAAAQLIGTRLLRDADFSGNLDWTNTLSLPRQDIGGRLHLYIRNTAPAPLQINDIAINGKPFAQLTTQATRTPVVSDSKWWRALPNPVPPGAVATIGVRLADLAADLPPNATFELRTTQGNVVFAAPQFAPQPSALWLPSLNVSDDMNTLTLFIGNRGSTPITLKPTGGLRINGGAEIAAGTTLPQTTLAPGDVVPLVVTGTAGALPAGAMAVFSVAAQSGESVHAGLRVFPYQFTVQSQMQGDRFDAPDRARHYVGDWDRAVELTDEPSGKGMTPMDLVHDVDAWQAKPGSDQRQSMVHNTSYLEGLVYDDIADIANSHWGADRQNLATYETWPKPNWFMPQDTWGRNEGDYEPEHWYPLEDMQFRALQAVGRGSKSIEWFLYQNHWAQGYGLGEGTDFARIYQDIYRSGTAGNPLTWDRVGRVSGVLNVAAPYLTTSAPYASSATTNVNVETVVSVNAGYKAVVTVTDKHYRYTSTRFDTRPLFNQTIQVKLPAYAASTVNAAYSVDAWLGITKLDMRKLDGTTFELTVPEVNPSALVVLGNAADQSALAARWSEVGGNIAHYGDGQSSLLASAQPAAPGLWRFPEYPYRKRITITNTGSAAATTLSLPLDLPFDRAYLTSGFRVVEAAGANATPVPFFAPQAQAYEAFTTPDTLARISSTCATSPAPANCRVLYANGALALASTPGATLFRWSVSPAQPQPWRSTFPNEEIPTGFTRLQVEAKLSATPFWDRSWLVVNANADGISGAERGRAFSFAEGAALVEPLEDGWARYTFDLKPTLDDFFGGRRGTYTVVIQTEVEPSAALQGEYPLFVRNISVAGGEQITIAPATPLAPQATRTFEVYYDAPENGAHAASPTFTPALADATLAPGIVITANVAERAGLSATISGAKAAFTLQGSPKTLLVRQFDANGTLIGSQQIGVSDRAATATLAQPMQAGDLLLAIPLQPGGEGSAWAFGASGAPLWGNVPAARVLPALWSSDNATLAPSGQRAVPFSLDMSADGKLIAVGAALVDNTNTGVGGIVRVLDASGKKLWEQTYPGRVFYVRFAPDSSALYVAANLSPDIGRGMYTNSHILKYTPSGAEAWRHKVGSGTALPAAQQGRIVFDMDVYPNGDVLYSEWNGFGVHLSRDNGAVVWKANNDAGVGKYLARIVPLANGGAVLLSNTPTCVDASGATVTRVILDGEFPYAAAAGNDCGRWVLAGTNMHVVTRTGELRIGNNQQSPSASVYVGRYPRAAALSSDGSRIATGTTDGPFSLLDRDGALLWQKRDGASYVTQAAFLPKGAGVVFAREVFDYQHKDGVSGWRFRDVVEAYTMSGQALWRHEGGWRTNGPFMTQFALSGDGTRLSVLSGAEVRYVNLLAASVPNSFLYPVEERAADLSQPTQRTFSCYLPLVAALK